MWHIHTHAVRRTVRVCTESIWKWHIYGIIKDCCFLSRSFNRNCFYRSQSLRSLIAVEWSLWKMTKGSGAFCLRPTTVPDKHCLSRTVYRNVHAHSSVAHNSEWYCSRRELPNINTEQWVSSYVFGHSWPLALRNLIRKSATCGSNNLRTYAQPKIISLIEKQEVANISASHSAV